MRYLLILLAIPLLAQTPARDEAAIREVVKKYVDARDNKVRAAIEALFTEDADQLVSSGEWRKGRPDVVKGTMASSQASPEKRTITVESIRFLAPTVALADGRYEIGARKMWTALVLTRGPSGWRIAAIRNMLPAAPAR